MLRPDQHKTKKFEDSFGDDATDGEMVKLRVKKSKKKLNRKERMEQRQQREAELARVLNEYDNSPDGTFDADAAVRAAEQSKLRATDVTQKDRAKLRRLKEKATTE